MKPLRTGRLAWALAAASVGWGASPSAPSHTEKVFATALVTPNQPMGEAKGIYPGRVVWVHDSTAVNQNCVVDAPGHGWFLTENNNQAVIDGMVSIALHNLTGQNSDAGAWGAIFRFHNSAVGKGSVGYAKGEKVFIKINATSAWNGNFNPIDLTPDAFISETSVGPVLTVLRQLVGTVGVDPSDIYIGDPLKHIYKHLYEVWHGEFPGVHYLDNGGYESLGRESVVPSQTAIIYYSDRGTVLRTSEATGNTPVNAPVLQDSLYTISEDAEYVINIPMLKGHMRAGMTMFAKNNFGSQTRIDASHLHGGLVAPAEMPNVTRGGYGYYRVQVDIMGHSLLGRKNLVYLMDALWATDYELDVPLKWQMVPFNNGYSASIFASLDPVAIESVGYDFLRSEFTSDRVPAAGTYVQMPGVDDYLRQAADKANWPSGLVYDPDNSGVPIPSLGTNEHWNNATAMQYSRNLDASAAGIELIQASRSIRTELIADQTTNPGGGATFAVVAIGAAPLSYQWQREAAGSQVWANLAEGAPYSGVSTASLSVSGATAAMSGDHFRCLVGNGSDPGATSNAAGLKVVVVPILLAQPASATVGSGARLVLSVLATDANAMIYQWSRDGVDIAGATAAELVLPSVGPSDSGAYAVVVTDIQGGSVTTAPAMVAVASVAYSPPLSTLVNLSTRAQVGTGANLMIAGFVVGGSGSKKVLVRAVGPTLTGFDPANLSSSVVLTDPVLQLTRPDGTQLMANDDWGNDPAIAAAASGAGAFALPAGSRDAALIATLPPGSYTALVTGKNGTTGVALVEVYDLDPLAASRLVNISTRAQVRGGAQALIAGFVVGGSAARTVLVRAVGPTLTAIDPTDLPAGVVLPDPQLQLSVPGGRVLMANDDWNTPSTGPAVTAAARSVGAFSLGANSKDSALVASLAPGQYTPIVTDKTGKVGAALIEVYEVP